MRVRVDDDDAESRMWEERASRLLRARLAYAGLTQKQLAERLSRPGRRLSAASINSKTSRGTFTAAFLLEALDALGERRLELPDWPPPE